MGGSTRMTLTTTVMVMETTGAMQLIVPLMITVFVAKVGPQKAASAPHIMCLTMPEKGAFAVEMMDRNAWVLWLRDDTWVGRL